MANRRTLLLAAFVALAGAAGVIYCRALDSPFIFDDSGSVIDNHSIKQLWPLFGGAKHPAPFNPAADLPTSGRPLVNFSLAVNYWLGGVNPLGYHLFNLLVHVLSALLLMAIVRRTLCLDYFAGRFAQAASALVFCVALLWAVHPLQTETVVYITQRTELMVGFFYLATLYASLRYWGAISAASRNTWLALATVACFSGMACKEVMVTAPVVVLLFERTFLSGTFRGAVRRSWPLYVGLFLSWGLLYYLNHSAPRSQSAGFDLGLSKYDWWLTQTKVLWMYLKLAVWPWPLAIHYEMPYLTTLGAAWPWLVPVLLLVIATMVLLWRRSAIGYVGAWVLLILSPTLVVPIITEVAAERRMYLPLAALVTLIVVGGYWLIEQTAQRRVPADAQRERSSGGLQVLAVAAALVATTLGVVSWHRLAVYHDVLTLWQDNVDHQPDNPLAHNNLGNALFRAGRAPEAIEHYQRALSLKPNYADAYVNFASALSSENRTEEAIENFRRALQLKANYPEVHCNLGVTLAKLGKTSEAIAEFQEALRLKPDYFNAHYNLGNILSAAGRTREAIEQYREALRLDPNDAQAHYNLGNAYQQTGQLQDAIQHFQSAVRLKADFPEAHNNLGSTFLQSGRAQEAVAQYQEAVKQNPRHAKAYANMAIAYAQMQRPKESISAAEKALELARAQGETALAQQIETWLATVRAN